jgi:hypothetical protein
LADHCNGVGCRIEPAVVVAVRVDEPGRKRESLGVNDALAGRGCELADRLKAIAYDADVYPTPRCSAPVNHKRVLNERRGWSKW